jgi:hypothetical protein
MLQLLLPQQYGDHEFTWLKEFGPVYLVKGCFGVSSPQLHPLYLIGQKENRLMISDPRALQYILNSPHFGHGPTLENALNLLYGQNAVTAAKGQFILAESFH